MVGQWNPQEIRSFCCLLAAPSVLRTAKFPRGQRSVLCHPQSASVDRTRMTAGSSGYRWGTRSEDWNMDRYGSGALCACHCRPACGEGRDSRNARQHECRFPDRWWNGRCQPNAGCGTPMQQEPTGSSREVTRLGPICCARDFVHCRAGLTPLGVQWS